MSGLWTKLCAALFVVCAASLLFGWPAAASRRRAAAAVASAQGTPVEKFALLVGIDKYKVNPLSSCVQDVVDMKQVLIEKFGFKESQIVTLKDEEATRERILTNFREHLIKNAELHRNAVIVFHFSGHGSTTPDLNGDEKLTDPNDTTDETIVPFDGGGRAAADTSGAFDILDDEIAELVTELTKYTPNVTLIFDSCHSGTVTRDTDPKDMVRELPPDTRTQPKQKEPPPPPPPADRYASLYACQPDERANQKTYADKKNGVFTFNLLRALRHAQPDTSYLELLRQIGLSVSDAQPNQHPMGEGNLAAPVFGGTAKPAPPFVDVESVSGRQITLGEGAYDGVKEGTIAAIYEPGAAMAGDTQRITNARVFKVLPKTSLAEMPEEKKIPEHAQAVFISPLLSLNRLRVSIQTPAGAGGVTAALSNLVAGSALLENAGASAEWQVAVRAAQFGKVFGDRSGPRFFARALACKPPPPGQPGNKKECVPLPQPAADEEVYYLAAGNGLPLLGYYVKGGDPQAAPKLFDALQKFAQQHKVRELENLASPLNGTVRVKVLRVLDVLDERGIPKTGPLPEQSLYRLDQSVPFKLVVENTSNRNLYIWALDVSNDGAISTLYSPLPLGTPKGPCTRECLKPGESLTLFSGRNRILTSGPAGSESFKIIATTEYQEFGDLIQGRLERSTDALSPLQLLMAQVMGLRDAGAPNKVPLADWTTARVDFSISDRVETH